MTAHFYGKILAQQVLRPAYDARERIVQLMGDAANQLADRSQFFRLQKALLGSLQIYVGSLQLLEQPSVFDSGGCLAGKVLEHRHVIGVEDVLVLVALNGDRSHWMVVRNHGSAHPTTCRTAGESDAQA